MKTDKCTFGGSPIR